MQILTPRVSIWQAELGDCAVSILRSCPAWGLAGLVVGAALSAGAVMALRPATAPASVQPASASLAQKDAPSAILPQRVILSVVAKDEIEAAIQNFPVGVQPKIRKDVTGGKYRLLWLTAWDWDVAVELGDTVSILANDYRRFIQLNSHRTRIAIPEPESGYIELRGEVSEDGIIAISVLSGSQPIALPRMAIGQPLRINIDRQERVTVSSKESRPIVGSEIQ